MTIRNTMHKTIEKLEAAPTKAQPMTLGGKLAMVAGALLLFAAFCV